MKSVIRSFFEKLSLVGETHEELTDTDVREALHEVVTYHFVWGQPTDKLPLNYRMFTAAGDQAVGRAVENFLESAQSEARNRGIECGQIRLDMLQNRETFDRYDEFIGNADEPLPNARPSEDLYETPEYDD